jgi:nucleoid DNA-binding protein
LNITALIRELLFGHDCVIVPGFGGFIGNYSPARIDRSSDTFYPPVKQISFNRNLNHNDGLLVGRLSGAENISYDSARNLVEEFVTDLRKKLGTGEKVIFDKIGSFINNHEGNVQFEPDRNVNYHLDSYGYEAFRCLPLEGYDVRKRIGSHIDKYPLKQFPVRKILWRAAIIVPLLAVLVAVPLKTDLFKSKLEATTMNPLVTAEFDYNKKAIDQVIKDDSVKNASIIAANIATVPEEMVPTKTTPAPPSEEYSYFVITGSFKSEENAVLQSNILKGDGFAPEIVSAPNGFYRVCAIACKDLNTAVSKKDSIEKKFPGTWISGKR